MFDPDDEVRFCPLPPPDDHEVERVARSTARGIARLLERRGLGRDADPDQADPLGRDERLIAALYAASVQGRIATGPRTGQRVMRFGDRVDPNRLGDSGSACCVSVGGLSLHANVAVPARDRSRLERLCRYVSRPAIAIERLSRLPDGRILYELRHRRRDGTTHVGFLPLEFLEKLAALIPAPRVNLVRYHGILAPAARHRAAVIPHLAIDEPAERPSSPEEAATRPPPRRRNYSWAELMHRVFAIDVLECPECQGRLRILAALHSPDAIRAILECLGLPPRPPPIRPADPDPHRPDLNEAC